MDSNASVDVKRQLLELCGITASSETSSSNIWDTEHTSADTRERFASIDSLLRIYAGGFTSTDSITDLPSRILVDAILIMSLGVAKEKLVNSVGEEARMDAEKRLEELFWSPNQLINVSESSLDACDIKPLAPDYVLWFGDTRKLQANLIVLRAAQPLNGIVEEQYRFAAFAATATIHHGRAKRPAVQATYGVVTDGLTWIFLHVNQAGEYSSIKLNWMEGNEHAIVGTIGEILEQAVAVKMICEDAPLDLSWSQMAEPWDSPRWEESEVNEMYSLEIPDDPSQPFIGQQAPSVVHEMDFPDEFTEWLKGILQQAAARGENVEGRFQQFVQSLRQKFHDHLLGSGKTATGSLAVTSIKAAALFRTLQLREEPTPGDYWRLNPWEVRDVTPHLANTLMRIKRVFDPENLNEAAIRLFIDAVLLEVLTTIKDEGGQFEGAKGKGKRPSTEGTVDLKDLRLGVETDISYIYPTKEKDGRTVHRRVTGRMDYNVWYGQHREAETNLVVVEAKQRTCAMAGRFQAAAYMALIQRARHEAGRATIPIYGVATDSVDWIFIRMDGQGNVTDETFKWGRFGGSQVFSLLLKIVRQASELTPAPTRELTREQTLTGRTTLSLTDSEGKPL
ncbi:hypothetical protein BJY00DRAFT_304238 [Aspergillus carlsbadensis]|nr:hypothetical protein BJY00DRAFT_304238 [Aspergillus carlsbadensis]